MTPLLAGLLASLAPTVAEAVADGLQAALARRRARRRGTGTPGAPRPATGRSEAGIDSGGTEVDMGDLTVAEADALVRAAAPNFSYYELTTTVRKEYLDGNREEGLAHLDALLETARVLQRVRDHYGRPVSVHSGFRGPSLNAVTPGASSTSQHCLGEAADFHVIGVDLREVWEWVWKGSGIPFGQLILEGDPPSWVHLSLGAPWRPPAKCGQVMTWSPATKYVYVERGGLG